VFISQALLDELIEHVREDPGNELCGVVAVADDETRGATRVYRIKNIHKSPLKFEMDGDELYAAYIEIGKRSWEIGGIYHSHVRSEPYPSQTDINFSSNWPGVEWIIVGLRDPEQPEVRSYLIEEGEVREVPIEVR
jgi:[CysO sulfur-carrier protein]-S-L-cysteine hydrolase